MKPAGAPWDVCQTQLIDVGRIYYDADFNCRCPFTEQSVEELSDSIVQIGRMIYPVLVQPWRRRGFDFRLIVGFRRFTAVTKRLHWPQIPAIVCEGLTSHQATVLNVTENLERKDLNLWEEACAVKRLYPRGAKLRRIATEMKKTQYWVQMRLNLLRMPREVQVRAATGMLSQANIGALSTLPPEEQIQASGELVEARARGKGKRLPGVCKQYKRRNPKVRGKEEINCMIEQMLLSGITGLPPRVAAWCVCNVSDEELLKDIEEAASKL